MPALVQRGVACRVDESYWSPEEGELAREPLERYDADGFQMGTGDEMGKNGGLQHGDWQHSLGRAATDA